jgi:trigger factor
MVPYEKVQCHEADNLTLLCPTHHAQVPKLLTDEQVAEANENPYCVKHGISSPFGLNFEGQSFECTIGSNTFLSAAKTDEGLTAVIPISVDDFDLIAAFFDADGRLYLSAAILDEFNLPILRIHENQIVYATDGWDIEFTGSVLVLREAARKILLNIEFKPPNAILIERARLLCNGVEIVVRPDHVFIANSQSLLVENTTEGRAIGVQVGRNERNLPVAFRSRATANSRYFMDDVGRREKAALDRMRELLSQTDD